MDRRWWKAVQWAAGLLIVAGVTRSVVRNWEELASTAIRWDIGILPLLGSVLVVWLCFAVLIDAWRRLVADRPRPALPWVAAARIWIVSSMAKYIPGKVWTFAGLAVLSRREKLSAWLATEAALVLQLLSFGTGVVILPLTGLRALDGLPGGQAGLWLLLAASIIGLLLLLWAPVAHRLERVAARLAPPDEPGDLPGRPAPSALLFGMVANAAAWSGYGVALWLVARGTMPEVPLTLQAATGAWIASYVLGFLSPLPGGIGVREGILFVLLRPEIGAGEAAALAAVSRIVITLTEVGAVTPFLLSSPEATRRVPPA